MKPYMIRIGGTTWVNACYITQVSIYNEKVWVWLAGNTDQPPLEAPLRDNETPRDRLDHILNQLDTARECM